MSRRPRTTKLPDRDSMFRRLCWVSDQKALVDNIYPKLLEMAEQEMNGRDIADMIAAAIGDYFELGSSGYIALMIRARRFVNVLIVDPEVRQDAHEYFNDAKPAANF